MAFGLSLAAGGMADELQALLKQKFLENMQRKQMELQQARLSEDVRQADMQHALGNRRVAVDEGGLGLSRERFGEDKRQFDEQAPIRAANVRLHGAQAADIERRPQAEQEDFTRDMQKLGLQGGQSLQQIGARERSEMRLIGERGRQDRLGAGAGGGSTGAVVVRPGIGPDGKPVLIAVNKMTGEAKPVGMPEGYAPNQPARPVTGTERQTLAYYNRAKGADESVAQFEDSVAQAGLGSQLQQQYAPNMLQTKEQQQYRQAQRAFTEARLRKESGAAIPNHEYENDAKTYFAQPGDSPEVRAQKKAARQTVLDGLKFASGNAFQEFYGDSAPKSGTNAPKVGDVKTFPNGKKGRWDGQGWVAQ